MIDIDETTQRKLRSLRLSRFAENFFDLVTSDEHADALPEEIFLRAVDATDQQRRERNIATAITQAHFRYPQASLGELVNAEERGINERQLKRVAATNWRENPTNVHLFAPAGAGKTYIACAIGVAACQAGFSVAYYRLDQLVGKLAVYSPTDPGYADAMKKLMNVDVLIIDDFLTLSIDQRGQEDLTKIVIDRDGRLPTIISSQSSAAYWVEVLPNRVGADSLVSRLNNGRRIQIGDYDMRRHLAKKHQEDLDHDS